MTKWNNSYIDGGWALNLVVRTREIPFFQKLFSERKNSLLTKCKLLRHKYGIIYCFFCEKSLIGVLGACFGLVLQIFTFSQCVLNITCNVTINVMVIIGFTFCTISYINIMQWHFHYIKEWTSIESNYSKKR